MAVRNGTVDRATDRAAQALGAACQNIASVAVRGTDDGARAGLDEAWRGLRLAFASGRITERLYDTLADVLARREAVLLGM